MNDPTDSAASSLLRGESEADQTSLLRASSTYGDEAGSRGRTRQARAGLLRTKHEADTGMPGGRGDQERTQP
jgi:hypothetical protein